MILQFLHDTYNKNQGDVYSCPMHHFDFDIPAVEYNLTTEIDKVDASEPLIIGGGGLLQEGKSRECLQKVIENHKSKIIIWALGMNTNNKKKEDKVPEFLKRADLCGIRDFGVEGFDFLPCISCLHPAFDKEYEIKNEIVCFEGNALYLDLIKKGCVGDHSIEETISFLGSAKTIVTSSYHGMYWGTLLEREVIVIPNAHSSKFYHFPVELPFATTSNYKEFIGKGKIYEGFLKECREKNIYFKQEVEKLLGISLVHRNKTNAKT